jgi:hypothetical protein
MSFVDENETTPNSQTWETPVHTSTISFYVGTRIFGSSILRDATNLYRIRTVEEDLDSEVFEPLDFRQDREPSPRTVMRIENIVHSDYDYFEEAMQMYHPSSTQAVPEDEQERDSFDVDWNSDESDSIDYGLADAYWERENNDEISFSDESEDAGVYWEDFSDDRSLFGPHVGSKFDSYEAQSGVEDDIHINPKQGSGLSSDEIKIKISKKMSHARKIKELCDSISDAEIELAARYFDVQLDLVHSMRRRRAYEPHSGADSGLEYWLDKLDMMNNRLQDYSEILKSPEVDRVIKHVEGLVLLILGMRESRSYTGVVTAILGYLSRFTDSSIFSTIRAYITEALAFEAQDGDEENPDDPPAWLEIFRTVTTDWKKAVNLPAWKYFQRILSLAVSVGLCQASDVNFTIGEMRFFTIKISERQASAVDFLDAIFATADYFVEAGYESFRTRSIRPFLFDNQTSRILDDAYVGIAASIKAMPTGDLEQTKYTTEAELAHVLENTLAGYMILAQQTKDKNEKRLLQTRILKLQDWQLDFIQFSAAGGLREAPYSIYLVGDPGIGKSMMTQVLIEVVLQANGIKYTPKQVATVNPGDKFASTVRNDTVAIILDDFGNFVLEFENENPLKYIIEICNNVVSYVPKADVGEKGKVVWRPKVVVTTSNLDDLLFNKLSNAPGSAKRRGIRMKPKLKSEYSEYGRFSEDKYKELHGVDDIPAIPDVYDINVQQWGTKQWEFFALDGKETQNISYAKALEFHISRSRKHFTDQKNYVNNHGKIRERVVICPHGKVKSECGECKKEQEEEDLTAYDFAGEMAKFDQLYTEMELEPHYGVEAVLTFFWRAVINRLLLLVFPYRLPFGNYVRQMTTQLIQDRIAALNFLSAYGYIDWLPDCVVESEYFEYFYRFTQTRAILMQYWQLLCCYLMSLGLFLFGQRVGWSVNLCIIWPYLFCCATAVQTRLMDEFRQRRGALPAAFTRTRDNFLKYALAGCFLLTGMALCYKLYQSRKVMEPHGNIMPKTLKEIKERDAEANVWGQAIPEELPSSEKSRCTSVSELLTNCGKNLLYVNYDEKNSRRFANGFIVESNFVCLPYHILTDEPRRFTFYRRGEHIVGGRFHEILSRKDVVDFVSDDQCIVQCCNSSPGKKLTDYITPEPHSTVNFRMIWQKKDGSHVVSSGRGVYGPIDNGVRVSMGYMYDLDIDTFHGMCGGVLVSDTKAPTILGVHIGGLSGTKRGIAVAFTEPKIRKLINQYFDKHPSALRHINEGTVYEAHHGITWFESSEIHPKSGLNFLPEDTNIRYFGSCKGRAKYYSEVVPTPIANDVTNVCGFEQEYAGPMFCGAKNWYDSLQYLANPAIGAETSLLDWAVEDYSRQLDQIFEVEGITEDIRPLTEIEIVSGQDGVRFVDAMKPNTSPGYPLAGPKSKLMVDLEPNETHNCPRTLKPEIWEEYRRCEAEWRKGRRAYPMFKACLKDEPTKKGKSKVRVFEAAPIVLQLAVRKYFLPPARLMSLFPVASECAVGINAMGPEWHALQKEIKKYGIDRIVAGDYSKYDLRMSAKLTSAAFRIIINLAKKCGYTEEDIQMMEAIATEIVYPMVAYNGDVLMMQGSNPSGQNLTVYINSIVNSLLNRIGFRMVYPEYDGLFSEVVSLITYGDDFKSSANALFEHFNHIALSGALESIDMKITMPDKTADPIPFLTDENCDFLKRHNRLHEVGWYLGALDEASIFKSLKAVLKSKHCSVREQSAQNIDGAIREWFLHGREVFERRQAQVREIAKKNGISHMCTMLDCTFDEMCEKWMKQYGPAFVQDDSQYDVDETDVIDVQTYEAHSGVEFGPPTIPEWYATVSEMYDWGNTTLPAAHECVHNNCSRDIAGAIYPNPWVWILSMWYSIVIATRLISGFSSFQFPSFRYNSAQNLMYTTLFMVCGLYGIIWNTYVNTVFAGAYGILILWIRFCADLPVLPRRRKRSLSPVDVWRSLRASRGFLDLLKKILLLEL